jgi:hypothetical protein
MSSIDVANPQKRQSEFGPAVDQILNKKFSQYNSEIFGFYETFVEIMPPLTSAQVQNYFTNRTSAIYPVSCISDPINLEVLVNDNYQKLVDHANSVVRTHPV